MSLDQPVVRLMQPCPSPVAMTAPLAEAATQMSHLRVNWLPVTGSTGRPVGVVSCGDIVRRSWGGNHVNVVADVMTTGLVYCRPTDSVQNVLRLMQSRGVPQIAVVDEHDRIVGAVSIFDLVGVLVPPDGDESQRYTAGEDS